VNRASRYRQALARQIPTTENRLAEAITRDVMDILNYGEDSVSVATEEVKSQDWVESE
jgi:phenylpyruvate tautomerase PptA (4-oxalocrotonate tautomerase family)